MLSQYKEKLCDYDLLGIKTFPSNIPFSHVSERNSNTVPKVYSLYNNFYVFTVMIVLVIVHYTNLYLLSNSLLISHSFVLILSPKAAILKPSELPQPNTLF